MLQVQGRSVLALGQLVSTSRVINTPLQVTFRLLDSDTGAFITDIDWRVSSPPPLPPPPPPPLPPPPTPLFCPSLAVCRSYALTQNLQLDEGGQLRKKNPCQRIKTPKRR